MTYETSIFWIKTIHTDIYEWELSRITTAYDGWKIMSVVRICPAIMIQN